MLLIVEVRHSRLEQCWWRTPPDEDNGSWKDPLYW